MAACATWADHQFGEARIVEAGRHPTMGAYHRVVVRCARCGRTAAETRWLGLPPSAAMQEIRRPLDGNEGRID